MVELGPLALYIMGHWTIYCNGLRVAAADANPAQAENVLVGQQVKSFEVLGPSSDFVCTFVDGHRLNVRSDTPEHESWNLTDSGKVLVVAGPGELWSSFIDDEPRPQHGSMESERVSGDSHGP